MRNGRGERDIKIRIKINTDNACFEDDRSNEIDRLLSEVRDKIVCEFDSGVLMDINGNRVGSFNVEE